MIDQEIIKKIKEFNKNGYSATDISRIFNISYPTVIKYLHVETVNSEIKDKNDKLPGIVLPFNDQIEIYLKLGVKSTKKINIYLKERGYTGSYQTLSKYLKIKKNQEFLKKANAYFRVETLPGEQAQVDWGHFGKIDISGIKINLYIFVFVLSYSRLLYAEFATSQKQRTLQHCHINAFKYIGGVPSKIRYDNMKTVVNNRRKENGKELINWNFEFKNFAQYYKFEPELCPKYYPRSKGKVEAAVKFLRNNFFDGEQYNKTFYNLDELNQKLKNWLDNYANKRKHPVLNDDVGTLWQKEVTSLSSIAPDWINIIPQIRRVSGISMVYYKKASYWVPKEYIRHKIKVTEVSKNGQLFLEFYSKEGKIYEHVMADPGSWVLPNDRDIIKSKRKNKDIYDRVKNHEIYKTRVEIRDLKYYSKLLEHKQDG